MHHLPKLVHKTAVESLLQDRLGETMSATAAAHTWSAAPPKRHGSRGESRQRSNSSSRHPGREKGLK